MTIDKFKHQHVDILGAVAALRPLVQTRIDHHAGEIAQCSIPLSGLVKLHVAVEDRVLHPALAANVKARLAHLGQQYQDVMDGIAGAYLAFAAKWNTAHQLELEPGGVGADANRALKTLYERMKREERGLYPVIEATAA